MRNFLLVGQFTDISGYGYAVRSYFKTLKELHKAGDINLKILNYSFEHNSKISDQDYDEIVSFSITGKLRNGRTNYNEEEKALANQWIDAHKNDFDILVVLTANRMEPFANASAKVRKNNFIDLRIGNLPVCLPQLDRIISASSRAYHGFVWEFDNIPESWAKAYEHNAKKIDKVICACSWNKSVVDRVTNLDSMVIPYTMSSSEEYDQSYYEKLLERIGNRYSFCNVGQFINRKGIDKLIRSFYLEFKDDDVVMVLKTYVNAALNGTVADDMKTIKRDIDKIKKNLMHYGANIGHKCELIVIPSVISRQQLNSIYKATDAFVTCTRGEGFGLPFAEFLRYKKPLLSPDKGGHLDFLSPSSPMISSSYEPCHGESSDMHSSYDMNFVEPSVKSAREEMRKLYELFRDPKKYDLLGSTMSDFSSEYLSLENNIKLFKKALGV